LAERGLEYLNTDLPTATLFPDGEAAFLLRSTEANAEELGPEWPGVVESFGANADLAFGVLGTELWSRDGLRLALRAYRRRARRAPQWRRRRPGPSGRDRERDADPALRAPARGPRGARPPLPLRTVGDADPLRTLGAAALGGRRAPRPNGDRAPHSRPERRL